MQNGVAGCKLAARRMFLEARAALGYQERNRIDACIAEGLFSLVAYEQADAVFTYISVDDEVDTHAIIERSLSLDKMVAAPRCGPAQNMEWYRIDGFNRLERSAFGILEPKADPASLVLPQSFAYPVALVPGLAFDTQGYRLGYGGGYYDTFLSSFPGLSIGLCRVCQMSDIPLPIEDHDVPVCLVVTEQDVYWRPAEHTRDDMHQRSDVRPLMQ